MFNFNRRRKTMMRRTIYVLFLAMMAATSVMAQEKKNGIGLRFGEPLGITYKKYLEKDKALEFNLGTAPRGWSHYYYKTSFDRKNKYDGYTYKSQDVTSVFYLDARYLFHFDIPVEDMKGSLKWYWGVGALFKAAQVQYNYIDTPPPNNWHTDNITDIDFGPQGIIGIQYTFEDAPVTLFGDFNLLLELLDRPTLRLLGGIGARYNF